MMDNAFYQLLIQEKLYCLQMLYPSFVLMIDADNLKLWKKTLKKRKE